MEFLIGLIIFGIPSAFIANNKGFKPFRWIIAPGLIGLIVVASMASATSKGISDEEAQLRAERGNNIGAIFAWINIGLSVLLVLFILGDSF
jgi:hypothetical protein